MTAIYGGDIRDFEKVLFIETEMLPWIRTEQEANSKRKEKPNAWD